MSDLLDVEIHDYKGDKWYFIGQLDEAGLTKLCDYASELSDEAHAATPIDTNKRSKEEEES